MSYGSRRWDFKRNIKLRPRALLRFGSHMLTMVVFIFEVLRYISFRGLCDERAFLIYKTVHLNIGGIPMTFLKVNFCF